MSVFDPTVDDLPGDLPIFPLTGVLLLPRAQLPLNIFEPRYLNMVSDALGDGRMIGMIQPKVPGDEAENPDVYPIGCAGRITQFEETEDGRFIITLRGIARFRTTEELPIRDGYRRVEADWTAYHGDVGEPEGEVDRTRLFVSLKPYFQAREIDANWDAIHDTPSERLINSLAMICPFEPLEKQALLEAATLADRLEVLTSLVEMAVLETTHEDAGRQ